MTAVSTVYRAVGAHNSSTAESSRLPYVAAAYNAQFLIRPELILVYLVAVLGHRGGGGIDHYQAASGLIFEVQVGGSNLE